MVDTAVYQAPDASVRSPRLNTWIAFFLFSLITMGSSIDAVSEVHLAIKAMKE
jgi:hypothetical protein